MSTDTAPASAPAPAPASRKVVHTTPVLNRRTETASVVVALVAAVVSVVAHAVLILLMMSISVNNVAGASAEDVEAETKIEEPQKDEPDLTNPDIGLDTNSPAAPRARWRCRSRCRRRRVPGWARVARRCWRRRARA
jgi:hypothetical protein